MQYLLRHNHLAQTVHQKLATKYNLKEDDSPYYKYIPSNVLESDNYRLYWNHSILTHKTIAHNHPDITFTVKATNTTYLIDITVPETHNVKKNMDQKV
jgi:uncharacterized membrane protein YfhO